MLSSVWSGAKNAMFFLAGHCLADSDSLYAMVVLNITSLEVAELTIDRLNLPSIGLGLLPELLALLLVLLLINVSLQVRELCLTQSRRHRRLPPVLLDGDEL